jgi:hypothetical protein
VLPIQQLPTENPDGSPPKKNAVLNSIEPPNHQVFVINPGQVQHDDSILNSEGPHVDADNAQSRRRQSGWQELR